MNRSHGLLSILAGMALFALSGCIVVSNSGSSCKAVAESCSSSSDCCGPGLCNAGLCNSNSCLSSGASCTRSVQCCGALLCNGGTCSGAAAAAGIYEVCNGPCVAGTCISANTTVGGFVGTFCTAGCNPSNPVCPDDGSGLPAVCVPDNGSTTSGQCYAGCPGGVSSQCPYSETCASEGNGVYFCVP